MPNRKPLRYPHQLLLTGSTSPGEAESFVGAVALDATSGARLPGASVVLEWGSVAHEGTTDSDGYVALGTLPGGVTAALGATLDGYEDFNKAYVIAAGLDDEIHFNMIPEMEVSSRCTHAQPTSVSLGGTLTLGGDTSGS